MFILTEKYFSLLGIKLSLMSKLISLFLVPRLTKGGEIPRKFINWKSFQWNRNISWVASSNSHLYCPSSFSSRASTHSPLLLISDYPSPFIIFCSDTVSEMTGEWKNYCWNVNPSARRSCIWLIRTAMAKCLISVDASAAPVFDQYRRNWSITKLSSAFTLKST